MFLIIICNVEILLIHRVPCILLTSTMEVGVVVGVDGGDGGVGEVMEAEKVSGCSKV